VIRLALIALAAASMTACSGARERIAGAIPFGGDDIAGEPVTLAELSDSPGVFAGRVIAVPGVFTLDRGEACLEDQGRAIAIRVTPEQRQSLAALDDAPVIAAGEFSQSLCPRGALCPALCARAGFALLQDIQPQ